MMTRLISLFIAASTFCSPALAEDNHGIAKIHTEDLELTYIDHVLAGRIGEHPIYAVPLSDEYGMKLQHRAGGQDFESIFRRVDDKFLGTVISQTAEGVVTEHVFTVNSVSAADGEIRGFLNDKPMLINISSETMNGGHYVNPKFEMQVGEKSYEFVLEKGEACIGCSLKIGFAIVSMLGANGIL